MTTRGELVAGVDLGGTNLRVGIVGSDGTVLAFESVPFDARIGPVAGVRHIADRVAATVRETGGGRLAAIGIGATGPVDVLAGRIRNPHTLPTWDDVDVCGPLAERFGVPVTLDNDAVVAAIGEWWQGAGQGTDVVAMVTFGTGIGVALVCASGPYRGSAEAHPEAGHQVVDPEGPRCYCGSRGCWEQLASGSALSAMAASSEDAGVRAAGAQGLSALVQSGNAEASRILDRAAHYAALGLVNVVAFYAPATVVLGGGAMNAYRSRLPAMQALLDQSLSYLPPGRVPLVEATLGERGGAVGAAYLAAQVRK